MLCALIALIGVIEHPDMPKSIMGIQGLNPWNIVLLVTLLAWAVNKRKENLNWDMPKNINVLLVIYFVFIFISFFRVVSQIDVLNDFALVRGAEAESFAGLFSEYIINCVKWVIPGILLFHGCNSKERFNWAVVSILVMYILLAIQVIKWMPISSIAGGEGLGERSLKILGNEVGFHRVNLSMMLAGASWAVFSITPLFKKRYAKYIMLVALVVFFGQALTGGRTGYVTWAIVGAVLSFLRWRKYLILAPLFGFAVILMMPAVQERFTQGFDEDTVDTNTRLEQTNDFGDSGDIDLYTITAGRNIAWPYVFEEIQKAPFTGYGRDAMQTTGIATYLFLEFGESFPHPHNAYLQFLLDNGAFGFLPVLIFYLLIVKYSISLFRDSRSPYYIVAGGVCLSLVVSLLVASLGSQTFYPREGSVGMWCAIFLMLRVYVERKRVMQATSEVAIANKVANVSFVMHKK